MPTYVRLLCLVSVFVLSATGCTTEFPLGYTHQSNFTYPESQVTPLKNVYAETQKTTVGVPILVSGKMKQEAIDDAIGQVEGSNLLINYYETVELTTIPLVFLTVFTTTYTVQGVAAEAEIN